MIFGLAVLSVSQDIKWGRISTEINRYIDSYLGVEVLFFQSVINDLMFNLPR